METASRISTAAKRATASRLPSGEIAMVHAIETIPAQRRKGAGRMIVQAAARFARDEGAQTLALAVTKANIGANALYQSLGMTVVSEYHYRQGPSS